jgi:hypothetical protein
MLYDCNVKIVNCRLNAEEIKEADHCKEEER